LIIRDNGEGFERKYENIVFEPFQKIGKKNSEGVGLGLTISQKIAELHKFNIMIRSQFKKGTEVIIDLNKR